MVSMLFSPFTVRGVEMKNRIMMAPMGTVAAANDGTVNDWHLLHYGARALGQVGLIMLEATAVTEQGRDLYGNLGLWNDEQETGMKRLVNHLHQIGAKVGMQLWHAGRKRKIEGAAATASPGTVMGQPSLGITEWQIAEVVDAFLASTVRAMHAGFDVIEIHAAHGYFINDFLSPLTNKREDKYGGTRERRYRLLHEIIEAIRSVWQGPLFVKVSVDEYSAIGNKLEDHMYFAQRMKEQGVDLIDCSSGGVLPIKPKVYPGYQVPFAEAIRRGSGVATAAVGLITTGMQAEEILQNGRADLVAVGRALLRDPFWPRTAAEQLGITIEEPGPYKSYWFPSGSMSHEN
ncbi:NADPH dehydrogenase NamA [Brevibacillus choshinensis]|uniref:NADPH dehydrogenase NamA n=1 Tax=Brevibacillus choshinensis TaxID=54911 RepID=UPI002E1AA763|nr:NADPH dehydrogenase NamA [Brevibacillus choshinensis]MED4784463.1 NADPH dehydrogenase NamA [Brevibacillus choshinensis]